MYLKNSKIKKKKNLEYVILHVLQSVVCICSPRSVRDVGYRFQKTGTRQLVVKGDGAVNNTAEFDDCYTCLDELRQFNYEH